jgi:putative DNA primase/helicase
LQNDRKITISAAGSRKATHWPAQTLYWSELVEKLKVPVRGTETLAAYHKLSKSQQDDLKDVGGFVAGTLAGNRRKASSVTGRDVITLDLDNIPAGGTEDVLRRLEGLGCTYAVYSTRKHEANKPRLRVLAPLSRTASADEYEPLARKLASIIGISLADPTTFEASRLMYWPSCSSDSQYVFQSGDRPFLDVDGLLSTYGDWRNITEWPEVPGTDAKHIRLAAKQGNPTEKNGIVGAFCKQYDIYSAMETFLPRIYEPTDDGRYTFIEGSTVGGAIIYENGLFLYSHHATDPCGGRLVNAFDLVRLHKFGELDDEAKPDTPVNKLPSFTEMSAFALNEAGIAEILNRERYEQATKDFGYAAVEENNDWISELKRNPNTGKYLRTIANIRTLFEFEPRLKGRVKLDTFSDVIIGNAPLPWTPRDEEEGEFLWTDRDDEGLLDFIERILEFRESKAIHSALILSATKNRFNPVVDYLNRLKWDGTKRLDKLFIDYLGAADTPYTRAVTRKSFVAAVARAMKPGVKYDTMAVLTGPQGLGKSTILQKIARGRFTDSIQSFDGKDAAELLQGIWLVEIAEMDAYSKSDVNTIKGFLSRTEDHYRASYARKAEKHPRKCVFFGTSNRSDYLKDPTGGRRFWPIDVGLQQPVKDVFKDLDEDIDQLWAEAVVYLRQGEALYLTGDLAEEAKRQQEGHSEQDPRESLVREFVDRKVPVDWHKRDVIERKLYWGGEFGRIDCETVERDRICAAEIWIECFNDKVHKMKKSDSMAINDILGRIEGWKKKPDSHRYGPYGKAKGGYVRT